MAEQSKLDKDVCTFLLEKFKHWHEISPTTPLFSFRDWVKGTYGITYDGSGPETFSFAVVNDEKYAWFLLLL